MSQVYWFGHEPCTTQCLMTEGSSEYLSTAGFSDMIWEDTLLRTELSSSWKKLSQVWISSVCVLFQILYFVQLCLTLRSLMLSPAALVPDQTYQPLQISNLCWLDRDDRVIWVFLAAVQCLWWCLEPFSVTSSLRPLIWHSSLVTFSKQSQSMIPASLHRHLRLWR